MGRIDSIFDTLRAENRKALMPFVVAGDPPGVPIGEILHAAERAGASIVEIGIPFSDPVADGPVIAAAMDRAINAGTTPESVFDAVREARPGLSIGLVAMVSVSLVYAAGGPKEFVTRATEAGFDGFIFPDAPVEESDALLAATEAAGASVSLLIAPTTPEDRAARIGAACRGFAYLLARAGITGERSDLPDPEELSGRIDALRRAGAPPAAVGFGISSADQVREVVKHADAAIVGSALVRRLHEAGEDAPAEAERFIGELASGL